MLRNNTRNMVIDKLNKTHILLVVLCVLVLNVIAACGGNLHNTNNSTDSGLRGVIGNVYVDGTELHIRQTGIIFAEDSNPYGIRTQLSRMGIDYTLFEHLSFVCSGCWQTFHSASLLFCMLNGFTTFDIYEPDMLRAQITSDTIFTFTDSGLLFGVDPYGNRVYTTACFYEFVHFIQLSEGYILQECSGGIMRQFSSILYFVVLHEERVVSFHELFLLTQ